MLRRAWRNRCPARRCYENGGISWRSLHGPARRGPYDDGAGADAAPAPSAKVLKIVEDIANLTLLEAADMSLLLKKRLRIQNVPVMSMGMNVMHDMWYDPLPLAAAAPPPPPPSRHSLGPSHRVLPDGLLSNPGSSATAAASSRSTHAAISESDRYLYQLPSASDTDSYDNEHDDREDRDHDRDNDESFDKFEEEEDLVHKVLDEDDPLAKPAAKPRAATKKSLSKGEGDGAQTAAKKPKKAPAAKGTLSSGSPGGSPAATPKKRGGRRPRANEGAVPSFTTPVADAAPPAKKPATAAATKGKAKASTTATRAKRVVAAAKAA